MAGLLTAWNQDLARLVPGAMPEHLASVGAELVGRWEEPHRHYHRVSHLVELLWALDELEEAGEVDQEGALLARVAGWFHDAVYDPTAEAGVNEADSRWLATDILSGLGVASDAVSLVEELIDVTSGHEAMTPRPAHRALHDADLWIFAAEPSRFDSYCEQIRREYAHVPHPVYCAARGRVLRSFADRDPLYRTEYARSQWEPQALANLNRDSPGCTRTASAVARRGPPARGAKAAQALAVRSGPPHCRDGVRPAAGR